MSLTNRKAPEDTVINREALTEGLDVRGPGRYYPEEFSSQLQIAQHQGSVLSEIPKSLAGIIVDYDDYKISSWHDEEQTKINRERIEADNEIRNRENELRLAASVEVYDKHKQMNSDVISAMEEAKVTGESQETAAKEIFDQYQNPDEFIDRPALQQMWSSVFQNTSLNTLAKAQAEDIDTLYKTRQAQLEDLKNVSIKSIFAGENDPEKAFQLCIPQFVELTKDLPPNVAHKFLNQYWNEFVLAKAQTYLNKVIAGDCSAEDGMNALRDLAQTCYVKNFVCTDPSGNVLKNEDGTEKTLKVVLNNDTLETLYKTLKQASTGGGGESSELKLIEYLDSFDKYVGWEEYQQKGTSNDLLGKTSDQLTKFMFEQLTAISISNASDSSKATKINEIMERYGQLSTFLQIRDLYKAGGKAKEALRKNLPFAIMKLQNDLASDKGIDWRKYSLNIGGSTLGLAQFNIDNPKLLSSDKAAKLYWQSALKPLEKLSKLITNGQEADIIALFNVNCNTATNTLVGCIQAGVLTTKDANGRIVANPDGVKQLKQSLGIYSNNSIAATSKYTPIPDSKIQEVMDAFNDSKNFSSADARRIGMQTFMQVISDAGRISDIVSYAKRKGPSSSVSSDLMLALALMSDKQNEGKNNNSGLRSSIGHVVYSINSEGKNEYKDSIDATTQQVANNKAHEVYRELGIPDNNNENNIYNRIIDAVLYNMASKGQGDKAKVKAIVNNEFKKEFKSLIKPLYVTKDELNIKGAPLTNAVFRYSPQMRPFIQNEYGIAKLRGCLQSTEKEIHRILPNAKIKWMSDDKGGVFRIVTSEGRSIGVLNGKHLGTFYYGKNYPSATASEVGTANGIKIAAELLLSNTNLREQFKNTPVTIHANEAKSFGIVGAKANKIDQLFGKKIKDESLTFLDPDNPYTYIDGRYSRKNEISFKGYERTIGQLYSKDDSLKRDLFKVVSSFNNPNIAAKIMYGVVDYRLAKPGSGRTIPNIGNVPYSALGRALTGYGALESEKEKYTSNPSKRNTIRRIFTGKAVANITGFAADLEDIDEVEDTVSSEEASPTQILNMAMEEYSDATKIRQAGVSTPISLAAIGNENYIDIFNNIEEQGYEITGVDYPGVITDDDNVDKGYLGKLPDIQYTTYLTNKEKQEFNAWVAQQREAGNILPEDNFEDYDMQGFWKNEVLNNTEYATATAETHFPDKYKKPNHPTFSNESIYYNEETAHLAGHWEDDNFIPPTKKEDGQATGYAANIVNPMYSGTTTTCPATTRRDYTKNEIKQLADYYGKQFQIPLCLVHALIRQESGGQQYVKSNKGAYGVMQLMSATAKSLGVKDSADAAQNIWGGMKYLAEQYKRFGNWAYALAAYNAGPGAVSKARGIPKIAETQRYVKNILKMAGMSADLSTFPVNFSFAHPKNKKFIDSDTNMLSITQVNNFLYNIRNDANCKAGIEYINTNRPELLYDKPEYADYKKFREMKNAKGEPLFRKGNYNGFQVMAKNNNKEGILNPNALKSIAEDAADNQTEHLASNSAESVQALITTMFDRYKKSGQDAATFISNNPIRFGLANLTAQEYQDYGVPLYLQQNPILQARTLAAEFQRANDILGSERKAIYALAGGKMVDENGSVKSWQEIKKDSENFMKRWFIKPSSDEKERNEINAIVAMYNSEYNKLRRLF